MKRLKRVTKRERKAMAKFLKEMADKQTIEVTEAEIKPKKVRKSVFLPLSVYLAKQAEKKHAKKHERDEKRAFRADKIAFRDATRKSIKEAKKLAREAKEAKRAARKSKIMSLVDQLGK